MTPREARHQLADDVQAALPNAWTCYPAPPGNPSAPCVILAPRAPYRVRSTVCDEQVLVRATVLVQSNAGMAGLDTLDDACTLVRQGVHASTVMAVVEEITDVGPVTTEGDLDYLSASLNITMEV